MPARREPLPAAAAVALVAYVWIRQARHPMDPGRGHDHETRIEDHHPRVGQRRQRPAGDSALAVRAGKHVRAWLAPARQAHPMW